jgi:hypothetical protein
MHRYTAYVYIHRFFTALVRSQNDAHIGTEGVYHILFSVRPQWSKLYTHVCTYGLPTFWLESDQVFIVDWLAKQTNRKASEIRNVTMLKASIWRGMHLRVVIDPTLLIGPRNYRGIIVMITVSTKRPSSRMGWTHLRLVPRASHPRLLPHAARCSDASCNRTVQLYEIK